MQPPHCGLPATVPRRRTGALSFLAAIAACCALSACSDRFAPTSITSDSAVPTISRAMGGGGSTTTTWDFVALAGTDGPLGSPKTFTISGQGSIVASASASAPNPGFQVYSKGFEDAPLSDERGLGICGNYGINGACGSASPGGDDEIGDTYPDASGNQTVVPSLYLDFTGLVSGSVVDSVTLSSVQNTEGYSVSSSVDGSTWTLVASGTGSSTTSAVVALAVPSSTKYLRFDRGPGGAGNNYIVATVTVTTAASSGGGGVCSVNSEITSNFNGTAIPGGDYIWFNAVLNVKGRSNTEEATVDFTNQTIQMGSLTVAVPNGTVIFSASATTAATVWDAGTNTWVTTVPVNYNGNVFLSGLGYQVPSGGMRGGTNPVIWSGTFDGSTTGLTFQWQFAAAVYTSFGSNDEIGVKPIDANNGSEYMNSDHAGTPENFKQSVTGGARGGGGSNFTGSYSGTAAAACK
jgi:hypothetical protein